MTNQPQKPTKSKEFRWYITWFFDVWWA